MLRWFVISLVAFAGPSFGQAADIPRTPDGKTDFQGAWSAAWITPLERPPEASQLVVPPADVPTLFAALWNRFDNDKLGPTDSLDVTSLLYVGGEARSSLIVEPADGKLPLTDAARGRAPPAPPTAGLDDPEQRPPSERCLPPANATAPMVVLPAGNMKQIVQTPDHFVLLHEGQAVLRVIPLNDGATGSAGAGRGRWEGDTLVVESSGFAPGDRMRAGRFVRFQISPKSKITERFRRVSVDEILYSFSVEDPDLYTRPWTAEMALKRSDARLYEWGCQEANYSLSNMLRGARLAEQKVKGREP